MSIEDLIPVEQLCTYYEVEMSFLSSLKEVGLIEIDTVEQLHYIRQDSINEVEKMIRLHRELDLNIEGIDTVLNLLHRINALQSELLSTKSRLRLYEDFPE